MSRSIAQRHPNDNGNLSIAACGFTAKGGTVAAIARYKSIPVRYVGTGEAIEDLRPFDAAAFVEGLFA